MNKRLAIITTATLLGLTFNSSWVLADTTTNANSLQPSTTVTGSTNPGQTATSTSTTNTTTVSVNNSSSTPTNTPTSTTDTANSTTDNSTGTTTGTNTSTSQLPPVQDSNGQTVAAGTLPDSPFYWLTSFIQKIELALTFNSLQKVFLAEQQALQKLAAAEVMAQSGKNDLAQKALNDYSDKISQAETFLTQIQDPNSAAAKALETGLAQTNAANIPVLSRLLDKLPPQAAQKVALNIIRSLEKAVKQTENKSGQADKVKEKAGEQNKSPMAKAREKGQQGFLMSSGHRGDQANQPQMSKPAGTSQTQLAPKQKDDQDTQDARDNEPQTEKKANDDSE